MPCSGTLGIYLVYWCCNFTYCCINEWSSITCIFMFANSSSCHKTHTLLICNSKWIYCHLCCDSKIFAILNFVIKKINSFMVFCYLTLVSWWFKCNTAIWILFNCIICNGCTVTKNGPCPTLPCSISHFFAAFKSCCGVCFLNKHACRHNRKHHECCKN